MKIDMFPGTVVFHQCGRVYVWGDRNKPGVYHTPAPSKSINAVTGSRGDCHDQVQYSENQGQQGTNEDDGRGRMFPELRNEFFTIVKMHGRMNFRRKNHRILNYIQNYF